jgi:hypothetical protein
LTTRLESRKKAYKKEKIFLQKSLTRPNRPQYNGVSQGPPPPPPVGGGPPGAPPPPRGGGGGGGGATIVPRGIGTVRAAALFSYPYL